MEETTSFLMQKEPHMVGLYVHIPFCEQKCSYCDFAAYERIEQYQDAYVSALLSELKIRLHRYENMHPNFQIDTLYFGGGTPTHLRMDLMEQLLIAINEYFPLEEMQEITVESNPGEVSEEYLEMLKRYGVKRLSFGVQVLDDKLLSILRRKHSVSDVYTTLDLVSKVSFPHVNVDLIYALPDMSEKLLLSSMEIVKHPAIDHVSIYGLQLEPTTQLYSQVQKGQLLLPSEEEAEKQYDLMVSELPRYGFERYEISNFSKPQGEAIHNTKYWQYKDYIGLGSGAHGFYRISDSEWYRYENSPYVVPYVESDGNLVVEEDFISIERSKEDYCFLGLRTKWGISSTDFEELFGVPFLSVHGGEVEGLLNKNFVKWQGNNLVLTPAGAKVGNYVFEQFIK